MKHKKIRKDFRLEPALVKWLKKYAKDHDMNETMVVESALTNYMYKDVSERRGFSNGRAAQSR